MVTMVDQWLSSQQILFHGHYFWHIALYELWKKKKLGLRFLDTFTTLLTDFHTAINLVGVRLHDPQTGINSLPRLFFKPERVFHLFLKLLKLDVISNSSKLLLSYLNKSFIDQSVSQAMYNILEFRLKALRC